MAPLLKGYDLTGAEVVRDSSKSGIQQFTNSLAPIRSGFHPKPVRFQKRHSMKAIYLCLSFCALLTAISGLTYILFDPIVKHIVLNKLVLKSSSKFAQMWENPPITPHFKVYFFNLTNPKEFFDGLESPRVEEVGPYVYHQRWTKEDVKWHQNGTMSYRTRKDFTFMRNLSVGNHTTDQIVTLNVPVLSAMYRSRMQSYMSKLALESVITGLFGYDMWVKKSPEELIWGYPEQLFDAGRLALPNAPKLRKFGFFPKKNNTADLPVYTMFTGEGDPYKLSSISKFNGEESLKLWGEHPETDVNKCNAVQGSDGATFNPYIQQDETLWFFNDQLCQSMPLVFEKEIESGGLPGYRYKPRSDVFKSPRSEPSNSCFCDDEPLCEHVGDGMFAVSKCQMDAPVILSWPHFLHANNSFLNSINGLHPDEERHSFYFDIQQTTGTTLSAKARIQINVAVLNLDFSSLSKVKNTIVPVLWFDEGLDELGPSLRDMIATAVLGPPMYKNYILCSMIGLFVSVFVIGTVAIIRGCMNRYSGCSRMERLNAEEEDFIQRRNFRDGTEEKFNAVKTMLNENLAPQKPIIRQSKHYDNEEHCMKLLDSNSSSAISSSDTSRISSASHSRNSSTGSNPGKDVCSAHTSQVSARILTIPEVSSSVALLDPETKLPNV